MGERRCHVGRVLAAYGFVAALVGWSGNGLAMADDESCTAACFPEELQICPIPLQRFHVGFPVQQTARYNWQHGDCDLPGLMTWSVVDGPDEFDIDGAGGLFYWTPQEQGVFDITIRISVLGNDEIEAFHTFTAIVDRNTITYPLWRDYLSESSTVEITGRATATIESKFHSYSLWMSEMDMPDQTPHDESWQLIVGPVYNEVRETDVLAQWDVSSLQDGTRLALRLVVELRNGNQSIVDNQVIIDRTSMPGWPKRVGPITHSVVAEDLDDDGRSELMVVTHHGELHAWNIDGSERFVLDVGGATYTAPSVGDIDGDRKPEVLWTVGSYTGNSQLWACHNDGTIVEGFPVPGPDNRTFRVTPTLADLDGDKTLDVIVSARAPGCDCGVQVFAYTYDVANASVAMIPGWPQTLDEGVWSTYSSASVADLDGDGWPEVVMEAAGNGPSGWVSKAYAWHADGQEVEGWANGVELPVPVSSAQTHGAGSPASSAQPAIADINMDGRYEIVIGANVLSDEGEIITTLSGATPSLSAAIGDLDEQAGNGLEIVVGGRAYDSNGDQLYDGFPTPYPLASSIIGAMSHGEITVSGSPRGGWVAPSVQAFYLDGSDATNYPKSLFGNTLDAGAPVQGDFDNDGMADVAVAVTDGSYGGVVSVWRCPHSENVDEVRYWPMLGHNARHTGCYDVPRPDPPTDVRVLRYSDRVIVRWADRSMVEDHYVVERSSSGLPFSFVPLAWLPGSIDRYVAWGTSAATQQYRVRAVRIDPTSGRSVFSRFATEGEFVASGEGGTVGRAISSHPPPAAAGPATEEGVSATQGTQ
ncbi:MAG: FG-GAP repeat domain-containing protein [Planctomycetota bacterium]|jgi:hypothetical protein